MKKNKLGNTGLEVSCLSVGLSEIAYKLDRSQQKQAADVLNAALDGGINFLDTVACYNISEELIGLATGN
jgi:aryl-alcohol dehydrogenase-like predicted oxidoreductase